VVLRSADTRAVVTLRVAAVDEAVSAADEVGVVIIGVAEVDGDVVEMIVVGRRVSRLQALRLLVDLGIRLLDQKWG